MPRKKNTEEFIRDAEKMYGDMYDYSKVNYINSTVKICVVCPKHGDFWITPSNFLNGHKCPTCSGRERITTQVFVTRSSIRHYNRYDYSLVQYVNAHTPVCIICPEHGEFWQKPANHMLGNGCPSCFGTPKSNTEEFIRKAREVYGDRYDYSKVVYVGNKDKVCIICPEHGEFWMSPNNHLRGHRCPGCYGTPKKTTEEFIKLARNVHGDKYDYSKVKYDGLARKVRIICPEHGEFWQGAAVHLNGNGCSKCSGMAPITQDTFIQRSTEIHQGKYDYSKTKYNGRQEKVCIICPEHGEFWQSPHFHLQGGNCPKCVGGVRLTDDEFIEKAKAVHEDRYDYSKVQYVNTATKVCIVCPEHGEFWQTPNNHLFGAGCPSCPQSQMEGEIRQFLINNNIVFEQEKSFDWLVYNRHMFLDFFLPDYGVAIECQGGQHFFPTKLFGGEDFFKLTIERDRKKKELCEAHGIKILYYSKSHIDYPYPVFESLILLLAAIKRKGVITDDSQWKDPELPLIFD